MGVVLPPAMAKLVACTLLLLLLAGANAFGSYGGVSLLSRVSPSSRCARMILEGGKIPQQSAFPNARLSQMIVLAASSSTETGAEAAASSSATPPEDYNVAIAKDKEILVRAAMTREEDSDTVYDALLDIEKRMRQRQKDVGAEVAVQEDILTHLGGSWRLVFTTGTQRTQERLKGKRINYFPIKAVQSFDTENWRIENGIYGFGTALVKFSGFCAMDIPKRRLYFDFVKVDLFGGFLNFDLKSGEAAKLGAASGLGSKSNVENAKRGRDAFFNWICADEQIAVARGGGGGLALWKRVTDAQDDEK